MKEIRRHQFANTYSSIAFELRIPKNKVSTPQLIFAVSPSAHCYSYASISRSDAVIALKKFRKVVDKSQSIA